MATPASPRGGRQGDEIHLHGFCGKPPGKTCLGPSDTLCAYHYLWLRLAQDNASALDEWVRRPHRKALNLPEVFKAVLGAWLLQQETRKDTAEIRWALAWRRRRERLVRDLRRLRARMTRLYREAEDPDRADWCLNVVLAHRSGWWPLDGRKRVEAALDALEVAISSDPTLTTRLTQDRRGAPERPWLHVEADLRRAGLTKENADELMTIVGLKPPQ